MILPQGKALHRLVIAAWLVALALAVLVPVYSDEVGWRLQERAGIDGFDKLYSEQCGSTTLARPVWFMWPVRWYSAFFNLAAPDPLWLRLSGVAYALVWAGLLLWLIAAMIPDRARRATVNTLTIGLLGLGTLPLQLVWSRPEQPILLAATAAMLIAWQGWQSGQAAAPSRWQSARWHGPLRLAAIPALAAIALSYHFKALVLIPLFATCLLACDRQSRTRPLRLLSVPLLALLAWQAASYWFARLACPGDPVLAAQHARQSLILGHQSPLTTLLALLRNYNLPHYITLAAPDITPMSNWLRPHLVSKAQQIIWSVAMILLWLAGFVAAARAGIAAGKAAWRRRALDLRLVFAIMLFGAASVYCVGQTVRNSYEAAFVLPLLALAYACALSATQAAPPRNTARLTGWAMLLSALLVGGIYGPSLVQAARQPGPVPGQPLSVSVADYASARADILATARLCGLGPQSPRLLLDDATYFALMRSPQPDHQIAVLDPKWNGTVGADPLAYLRANHASGMVLACQDLPPALRRKAHAHGAYCCMSGLDWAP